MTNENESLPNAPALGPTEWTMPPWMEPYRHLIQNTGGNRIERLMNLTSNDTWGNIILAGLVVSVDSQITLLHRLRANGFLAIEPCEHARVVFELKRLTSISHYPIYKEDIARVEKFVVGPIPKDGKKGAKRP